MNSQGAHYAGHVRASSQLLIRLRAELGNDLDKALIMAVIAERRYAAIEASRDPVAPLADPAAAQGHCGINALSVALYAGIPRETARRQIAVLVARGWVACDARGSLSATPKAAGDLAEGTAETLGYIRAITRDPQR